MMLQMFNGIILLSLILLFAFVVLSGLIIFQIYKAPDFEPQSFRELMYWYIGYFGGNRNA